MPAGYSKTTLGKKLGLKDGYRIRLINQPTYYLELFTDWPEHIETLKGGQSELDFIHIFTKEKGRLNLILPELKKQIKQNGIIWVSWPKKTSKMPSDLTEDVIRESALDLGLVDVKVCAIDNVWSGLKLVIPLKYRNQKIHEKESRSFE